MQTTETHPWLPWAENEFNGRLQVIAHRIDWKAGDYARKLSRNQSGRQQRIPQDQAIGPSLVRMPLLALRSEFLRELHGTHGKRVLTVLQFQDSKLQAGTFDCLNFGF